MYISDKNCSEKYTFYVKCGNYGVAGQSTDGDITQRISFACRTTKARTHTQNM